MISKKKTLISGFACGLVALGLLAGMDFENSVSFGNKVGAADGTPTISLDQNVTFNASGDATINTALNNPITFKANAITAATGSLGSFAQGAYLYNATPLTGLETIGIAFDASATGYSFKVVLGAYVNGTINFNLGLESAAITASTTLTVADFSEGVEASYFKVIAQTGSALVTSISLDYLCSKTSTEYVGIAKTTDFNFDLSVSSGALVIPNKMSFVLSADDLGTLKKVTIDGVDATANFTLSGGTLTATTDAYATQWGKKTIDVATLNGTTHYLASVNATLISKLIGTKADLDSLVGYGGLSDLISGTSQDGQFGGYFALSADIAYDGVYPSLFGNWAKSGYESIFDYYTYFTDTTCSEASNGFLGTFDGRGHTISGLESDPIATAAASPYYNAMSWGFIPVIKANGVVKDIAFTGAICQETAFLNTINCGKIENVYVSYSSVTMSKTHTIASIEAACATLATKNGANSSTRNFFIDASAATVSITGLTGKVVDLDGYQWNTSTWGSYYTNVNGIGGSTFTTFDGQNSRIFADAASYKATVSIGGFDTSIWTITDGIPAGLKVQ